MNVLVQLLYSLRQGILTSCAMDPFASPVKPTEPFKKKGGGYLHTQTELYNIIDCTTKEINYAQIQF